ncbi:MAG: transcription antitermination factor NusB [Ruminococcaceae bacterium]|nr:transcription antitermination factor NusB [Oscillospiraceae bacterium]
MNRREVREAALCMIFDYSFHSDDIDGNEQLELYLDNFQDKDEKNISEELRSDEYFTKVYFGVISNIDELDAIIEANSKKWSSKRISRVSRSILRLALYEIRYVDDIPEEVSINEAVELAKKFDADESYSFVNGILGAYVRGEKK